MKNYRGGARNFTPVQIAAILKEYDDGRQALNVCRQHGISKATLFNWRRKYDSQTINQND